MEASIHFALTKWYVDCVDSAGRTAIAYWASFAWHAIAFTWHDVAVYEADRPRFERMSLAPVAAPEHLNGEIVWRAPALGCTIRAETRQPPTNVRLLDSTDGAVEWRCEAPVAETTIEVMGHAPIHGPGYAERLTLTVLPWRLPIDVLRWGRWLSTGARV